MKHSFNKNIEYKTHFSVHNKFLCSESFLNFESIHRCKCFLYLTWLITYKIHKYRNWETGFPGNHGGGFCPYAWNDAQWYDFTGGGSSVLILPLKLLTEKSKIFILLGSIRDPLYLFFFLRYYPQIQQSSVGGRVIRNTLGGGRWGGVRSVSQKSQLMPLRGYSWKVLVAHFLSLVQKERPQEWPVAFRPWQGHTNRAVFLLGWVETEARREACSGTAQRARHRKDRRMVGIRKLWFHTWY